MFRIIRGNRLGPAGYDSATDEFADAREDEVGYVSNIDAVESCHPCDAAVDRKEKLTPADSPEPESERAGSHRQKYELPSA